MPVEILTLLQILWGPLSLLLIWQHQRINSLSNRMNQMAHKEEIAKLQDDTQQIKQIVTDLRISLARWQGQQEYQK